MATVARNQHSDRRQLDRDQLRQIPIELIDPNPNNPREDWETQQIDRLIPSVRRFGLIEPAIVRALITEAGERFELIAGERRFRAAKAAGEKTISCIVRNISGEDALAQMLIENLERKALSPLEKARFLKRLCTPCRLGGAGLKQKDAARLFGKTQPWAASLLGLLELPEAWQQRLARGEIELTQARSLIAHRDRPELLKAIELDMKRNAFAWRTQVDFDRSLKLLLADQTAGSVSPPRSPRAAKSVAPGPRQPSREANQAVAGRSRQASAEIAGDRSEPSAPAAEDVAAVCAAIARLSDQELSQVEAAARDRREQLRKQR